MNVFERIIEWAGDKPLWLQDALRRIWLNNGVLTHADEEDIYKLLKLENGFTIDDVLEPAPLALIHGPRSADLGKQITLTKMYNLKGVNALASGQVIEFEPEGMTVIYGENASGKTGYGRVMKSACRARGAVKKILGNVFAGGNTDGVPEAQFEVKEGEAPVANLHWKEGEDNPALEPLAKVAVFDSQSARVYLEEKNLLHVPYGLDVFTRLSKLCADLKEKIKQAQTVLATSNRLPSPTPEFHDETESGKLYARIAKLSSKPKIEEIDAVSETFDRLSVFSAENAEKLKELSKAVEEDPKSKADRLDKLILRLERLDDNLNKLAGYFSATNFQACAAIFQEAKKLSEAAKKMSRELFEKEPLPGIGDDLWREMFLKLREYSLKLAYPDEPFPVVKNGARCPACQQELSEETKARLKKFNDFVNEELNKKVEEKKKTYLSLAGKYQDLDTKPTKNDPALLDELTTISPWLSSTIGSYLTSVQTWETGYKQNVTNGNWVLPKDLNQAPDSNFLEMIDHLRAESKKLREAAKPEEREKLLRQFAELKDKKTLFENKVTLSNYVSATRSIILLEACSKEARGTAITDIGKKLTKEIVTDKLKEAFKQELDGIGLAEVREKITMTDSGSDGGAYVRLQLASEQFNQELISSVLSDGELRMVAVASFLADLSAGKETCTIVFDDPVSSLDHKWRQRAAKRLIRESSKRQVIIFTHDIVFFRYLLQEKEKFNCDAVDKGLNVVKVKTQLVEKICRVPGYCSSEQLPWELKSVKKRIGILKEDLQQIEALHRKGELNEYKARTGLFAERTRQTWEKAVECDLLGAIVQRFGDEVQTRTLIEIQIEDRDWARVESGMSACSEIIHDKAEAKLEEAPSPEHLQGLLAALEKFVDDVKIRKKSVRDRREKLLKGEIPEEAVADKNLSELRVKLDEPKQKVTIKNASR